MAEFDAPMNLPRFETVQLDEVIDLLNAIRNLLLYILTAFLIIWILGG